MRSLLPILLLGFIFINCGDKQTDSEEQLAIDEQIIEDYLAANNLTAEEGNFGLRYIIEEPGTGENPTAVANVIVNYKGYYPDGTIFDQRNGSQFSLQNVIPAWQIGIPLFKKGGKGTLFIPSSLGYGQTGTGTIPPNQVIIFDVELLNFN